MMSLRPTWKAQYEAALNSGDRRSANAAKIFLDQMGTEEGRTLLKATLMLGASDFEPEKGMYDNVLENIQKARKRSNGG
jgi:hypothetical protein